MATGFVMPYELGGTAWDTITLGGLTFTGLVEVSGDGFKKKLDRRRSAGADGARIVDKGFDLVDITFTLTAWEPEHAQQLERLIGLVAPRGGNLTRRRALDVVYPSLAALGITQVYATSGDLPKPDEGKLVWTLKLTEYREPLARSTTTAPRPQPQSADVPIDRDINGAFDRNPLPTAPSASGASSPTPPVTTTSPATFSR